ncbi:MAG: hypothetical protein QXJ17_07030 [Nitrososphaeria archaeon]
MPSNEYYIKRAVSIHGHYGPSLMLGLKTCLYAKSVLGNVTKCVVRTIGRKPYLCALDGVKASSKCEIIHEEYEGLSFIYFNGQQKIKMTLKVNLLSRYFNRPWDELEALANEVVQKDISDLFEIVMPPFSIGG